MSKQFLNSLERLRDAPESIDAQRAICDWILLRTARLLKRNADDLAVAEIAADVAVKVLSSAVSANGVFCKRSPAGYVTAMIQNRIIDAHRRRGVRVLSLARCDESQIKNFERNEGHEEVLAIRDLISNAWPKLRESDRAVLTMRYWEDLPFGEIARLLGVQYSAAVARERRARDRLRSILIGSE